MPPRPYDYGRLRTTGKNLISRFGVAAELRRGAGAYPTTIALGDYKSRDVDGTKIQAGDFVAYVAPADLAVEPLKDDQLFWQGRERTVVSVRKTKPGPVVLLYELQVRGPR